MSGGPEGNVSGEGAGSGPRVKICGITRRGDARVAVEAGADYIGVVLAPGSPRTLGAAEAAEVVDGLAAVPVVVLVDPSFEEAVAAGRRVGAGVLQLHGHEEPELLTRLRDAGTWKVWKAVPIRSAEDVSTALGRYGRVADALLLDGWHPRMRGGTGTPVPREAVRGIGGRMPPGLELVAAGGLDPHTVHETVRALSPDVVDVSSGVERRPGVKDPGRIRAFIRNAGRSRESEPR